MVFTLDAHDVLAAGHRDWAMLLMQDGGLGVFHIEKKLTLCVGEHLRTRTCFDTMRMAGDLTLCQHRRAWTEISGEFSSSDDEDITLPPSLRRRFEVGEEFAEHSAQSLCGSLEIGKTKLQRNPLQQPVAENLIELQMVEVDVTDVAAAFSDGAWLGT
jgi:hypothetical protein